MLEIFLPSLARLHKFAGNEIHLFSPGLVTTATVAQLLRLHKASAVCGRGHAEVNPLVRVFHAFACQCLPDISFIHSLSLAGRQQLAFNYFKLQQAAAAALDVPQSQVTCVACRPLRTVANTRSCSNS